MQIAGVLAGKKGSKLSDYRITITTETTRPKITREQATLWARAKWMPVIRASREEDGNHDA